MKGIRIALAALALAALALAAASMAPASCGKAGESADTGTYSVFGYLAFTPSATAGNWYVYAKTDPSATETASVVAVASGSLSA